MSVCTCIQCTAISYISESYFPLKQAEGGTSKEHCPLFLITYIQANDAEELRFNREKPKDKEDMITGTFTEKANSVYVTVYRT